MNITLDFRTKQSICAQIQEQVQEMIREKQLLPGDQLPAVRDLAAVLKINFNTVARAYRDLDRAGWISTQQGRGTYVLEQPSISSETEEKEIGAVLNKILDRLFTEIAHRAIPESRLWEALERRNAMRTEIILPVTQRRPRRISRKPGHPQVLAPGPQGSRRPKRKGRSRLRLSNP